MRVTARNLVQYMKVECGASAILTKSAQIKRFAPLLQEHYGGQMDCSLTCITAIIHFLTQLKHEATTIYGEVETVAKNYFYNEKIGTSFVFIPAIFNKAVKKYSSKVTNGGFGKNLGYTLSTITAQIDEENPLILSLRSDGLNYYKNHSVTVIGYKTYSNGQQEKTMLMVYDNWDRNISYLDYEKISFISALHYLDDEHSGFLSVLHRLIDMLKK